MAACSAHAPATAHAVLHSIAVPAHAQGAGAGSRLLRQLLDRADEQGLPVYLESSNVRNVGFYTRHGFRMLGTVPLPGGTAQMTPLLRRVPH
jgi:N-acetylglutamate synthase-like GNAT family acetyltransferase